MSFENLFVAELSSGPLQSQRSRLGHVAGDPAKLQDVEFLAGGRNVEAVLVDGRTSPSGRYGSTKTSGRDA
jgi:hypothetical protein